MEIWFEIQKKIFNHFTVQSFLNNEKIAFYQFVNSQLIANWSFILINQWIIFCKLIKKTIIFLPILSPSVINLVILCQGLRIFISLYIYNSKLLLDHILWYKKDHYNSQTYTIDYQKTNNYGFSSSRR